MRSCAEGRDRSSLPTAAPDPQAPAFLYTRTAKCTDAIRAAGRLRYLWCWIAQASLESESKREALEAVNGIEMAIHGSELHLVFHAQCRDPEVIFWNRLAFLFQVEPKSRIHLRGRKGDVQDAAAGYQPLHFCDVLFSAAGVQGTVSQFTNDRHWQ
jgi:hypothetical protein